MPTPPPVALTIAGSDSGGGAGIQADLKTFHAFGVFGTSALTAVTAQNTLGVRAVHPVPEDVVWTQIEAIAEDLPPTATKSGMLATRRLVETVARAIDAFHLQPYVLDPVMVATSGDRLLDEDAESAVRDLLVPRAAVVTPNAHEAALLTGHALASPGDLVRAGERLLALGARAALVKGGHLDGPELVDALVTPEGVRLWRWPRRTIRNTHGTGCTLSAAIAAGLAQGRPLIEAVDAALVFVHRALEAAPPLGHGHGPLNHWAPVPDPAVSAR